MNTSNFFSNPLRVTTPNTTSDSSRTTMGKKPTFSKKGKRCPSGTKASKGKGSKGKCYITSPRITMLDGKKRCKNGSKRVSGYKSLCRTKK